MMTKTWRRENTTVASSNRGFETALAAAELSTASRTARKMGSALYAGPRLLSVGYNRYHSHPDSNNIGFCRSLHCEHVALLRRQHFDKLSGHLTMYVARRLADGSLGCSKPCDNCVELCRLAGVRRIRYVDEQGERKEITL